ncbi:TPA: ammonium transporter [Staphylococcus aureus]|nr:ammonium transporter [Staphylococcus aureus]
MNLNDTIFMFLCTLLVWLMTPGLSLFYGGLVQSKNALNTVMQSMAAIVLVTFVWITVGFTISFGEGNLWFGNWEYTFLNHVGFATQEDISPHIPFALFMLFQMMFCTIAISILSGSIAEKMKFIPYLLFVVIWTALVYSPVAHWVWGGGWINKLGVLDFAGGTVVHITSGVSGLVLAIMIGKGNKHSESTPHNLIITLIGGIFVWIGWYGFNVGSAFTFDNIAMLAFTNTVISASAGAIGWLILEYIFKKTTSLLGLLLGALAGLVVINYIKVKLKYHDALDAFGIHGVGGIIGAVLTAVFQSKKANPDIENGFIYTGDIHIVLVQILCVTAVVIFSIVMTFIIAKVIKLITPLSVTEQETNIGLDKIVHGEHAYFEGELNRFNKHIRY